MWRRVSLLRLILALRPLRPLVAPVVTPEAERFAWQMILETMVHLMAQHFSWPVEDGVSPRPGVLADIGCSFSPCCHVSLPPRPQASVWELKGTQKFTCCRHPFCPCFFYFFYYDNSNQPYASFSNSSGTPNRVTVWKPVQTCPLALFSPERGQLLASIIEKKNHFDVNFLFWNNCNSFSVTQRQHDLEG